ncbi:MAG TPA: PQQ-binding-like beta-propeller repeat protein [Ktedonobacterales bacterium]|nr:PQQ-binding-like beta-propeller repeat protein [Ktedonobacterales bacterium]
MNKLRANFSLALLFVFLLATLAACDNPLQAPISNPHLHPQRATGDWPMFGYAPDRSGVNPGETLLTPATVGHMQKLWQVALPDVADSSPILLHGLRFPDGKLRDVLYVTTRDGRIIALDANDGSTLWSHQPVGPKITNSSAVADPNRKYIYAYGLDGYLHKYNAITGAETLGHGWPVQITRMRDTEKEASALNLANGYLYVTTSGYIGDAPPYQGHLVTINLATGAIHVFNSLCSQITHLMTGGECTAERSGAWARGGAVVDPVTGDVFFTTGNGPFDANSGGDDFGDTILKLSPDGSHLLDSYTPTNYATLDAADEDLGSVAPALLPSIKGSKTPLLLAQGGKDGVLRLINRQNMSGAGAPGHVGGELQAISASGCNLFAQPAVWTDPHTGVVWLFAPFTCGLTAYQVVTNATGQTRLRQAWKLADTVNSPVVAGGVLFAIESSRILALTPQTGATLWSSSQGFGAVHWESPIVIGGALYVADENATFSAYGLAKR